MNKKIQVIDLLNERARQKPMPYRIKCGGEEYQLQNFRYINMETKRGFGEEFDLELCLFTEVEILEDNTEEIEEIGEYCDLICMTENEEVLFNMIKVTTRKVNELVRKINYIERKINGN